MQSRLWSGAFVMYATLCVLGAIWLWRLKSSPLPEDAADTAAIMAPPPTLPRRVLWLFLPAFASLMLLATTNHVCQDVAVVPLLWVVPLALYLLSFIVCFDHQRWYLPGVWAMLAMTAILAVSGLDSIHAWLGHSHNYVQDLVVCFAALFASCMVCHGELVRLRPDPRHLTEFYLFIAAGGALGGALVSLAAPHIFSGFWEWQIGLVLCFLLAAAVLMQPATLGTTWLARLMGGISVLIGLATILGLQAMPTRPLYQSRNFYGVVSVTEVDADDPAAHAFRLIHGNTIHGEQYADPAKRRRPTTYYAESSGVGQAVRYLQKRPEPMRVGVVGLGAGTMAAYARPGDEYCFYEINPEVPRLAKKYFSYLGDCRGSCKIVMGDARLSLERQPPQRLNVLVLDAFSGDSIPSHLLTEAFAIYRRHMAPGGITAVHITNNYLCRRR